MTKPKSKLEKSLLFSILVIHFLCFLMCFHLDFTRHQGLVKLGVSHFAFLLTWWCGWASLLTIIWVIYKLVSKKNNYFSQLLDLVVVVSNLIMGIIFFGGLAIYYLSQKKLKWVAVPKNVVENFNFFHLFRLRLSTTSYWLFYTLIWHSLPPILCFYYFKKFSQKDLLKKNYLLTFASSLINPTIYFFYVILRPIFSVANRFNKSAYDYPFDYPYFFFYRCAGKKGSKRDIGYSKSLSSRFFWVIGTFFVAYVIFSLLAWLLVERERERIFVSVGVVLFPTFIFPNKILKLEKGDKIIWAVIHNEKGRQWSSYLSEVNQLQSKSKSIRLNIKHLNY